MYSSNIKIAINELTDLKNRAKQMWKLHNFNYHKDNDESELGQCEAYKDIIIAIEARIECLKNFKY